MHRWPTSAAYPIRQQPARLFALAPGEIGRYQANFRMTGCAWSPDWFYEQWTIHIAPAPARADLFTAGHPTQTYDDRAHLYGGHQRPSGRRPAR